MTDTLAQDEGVATMMNDDVERFDAIVIGAGVTGLYQLYRLRELGFSVRIFEDASGVGGTWYWNRYPGARFDSESYTYGYSFSEELLQEWDWKEYFSGQPENERYLNYVADKFDLRRHIEFNAHVTKAAFDEHENLWLVDIADGRRAKAQFLITAVGLLSAHYIPDFQGLDAYKGRWCHTGRWPQGRYGLGGQAGGRRRHRRHRRTVNPGNRRGGRPPDRLPTDSELLRTPPQRSD